MCRFLLINSHYL